MKKITDEEFIDICNNSISMRKACEKIGMPKTSFTRKAKKLGCYRPNQGLKGGKKNCQTGTPLDEILNGDHPQYQGNMLKNKLIKAGYKENKCEICGIQEWNGKNLRMELDHIDGDNSNHRWENIRLICPNCHSQLPNYCGNNKKKFNNNITDQQFLEALKNNQTIRQAIISLGLDANGSPNYKRAYKLLKEYGI